MRRFLNNKGAAFIPFLLGVGLIWGVSLAAMSPHWLWPKLETHHYKLIKDPKDLPFGYGGFHKDQVIFDVPIVIPVAPDH